MEDDAVMQPDGEIQQEEQMPEMSSFARGVDSREHNHNLEEAETEHHIGGLPLIDSMPPPSHNQHGNVGAHSPNTPPAEQENDRETTDSTGMPLDVFDWEHLQARFGEEMARLKNQETQINEELVRLMDFYTLWMQTPMTHDYERAVKRLRTRIAYVQHEETQLQQKRAKHDEVVHAFQSALALLSHS